MQAVDRKSPRRLEGAGPNGGRRALLKVLLASGASVMLSACDRMPASAVAAWRAGMTPPSEDPDPRIRALAWAMLAPNPHNLQAWLADLRRPGEIDLRLDPGRLLPATDPQGRQVLIGGGAFLECSAWPLQPSPRRPVQRVLQT